MSISIEFKAPDIAAYKEGTHGVEYVHQFDSGKAGPHVVISSVIHGNEICGAYALHHLLQQNIRPQQGKLTLIFANVEAYRLFDERNPYFSRYIDEDMNRLWDEKSLNQPAHSQETIRIKALRQFIDQADYLLDLHSMGDSCPALTLCGPCEKGLDLAKAIAIPEVVVIDTGHQAGKRLRDYADFNDPQSPKNALLIECGQHWEKSSAQLAVEACYRFLHHFDLIPLEVAAPYLSLRLTPQKILEVTDVITVQDKAFFFDFSPAPLIPIEKKGTLLGHDGMQEVYTPYDNCYLIMPQNGARTGQTAVRLAKQR